MDEIIRLLTHCSHVWFTPLRPYNDPRYAERLHDRGVAIVPLMQLRTALREIDFDLAIVSRAEVGDEMMHIIRRYSPRTQIIFDTVDIASVRFQREFEITGEGRFRREAGRNRRIEQRLVSMADETWCVTDTDAEFVRELDANASTRVIPTIHNPNAGPTPLAALIVPTLTRCATLPARYCPAYRTRRGR